MTFDEWAKSRPLGEPNSHGYLTAKAAWQAATRAEREECAKVCDEYAKESSNPMNFAENCAAAIRARSKKGE